MRVDKSDILVSFDVCLFIKVPIDEALHAISIALQNNSSLRDKTAISIETICNLVELCLKSTYYQFENDIYKLVEGAALRFTSRII